jgi:hypothetical protein
MRARGPSQHPGPPTTNGPTVHSQEDDVKIVYATSTTSITDASGLAFTLHRGEVWDADDPLVKLKPQFFSETPVIARVSQGEGWEVVEQATAAPGERRKIR